MLLYEIRAFNIYLMTQNKLFYLLTARRHQNRRKKKFKRMKENFNGKSILLNALFCRKAKKRLYVFSYIWNIHIIPGFKDTIFFKALWAKSFSSFIFL